MTRFWGAEAHKISVKSQDKSSLYCCKSKINSRILARGPRANSVSHRCNGSTLSDERAATDDLKLFDL